MIRGIPDRVVNETYVSRHSSMYMFFGARSLPERNYINRMKLNNGEPNRWATNMAQECLYKDLLFFTQRGNP